MSDRLSQFSWPASKLGEALKELADCTGLASASAIPVSGDCDFDSFHCVRDWIEDMTSRLGVEAVYTTPTYPTVDQVLATTGTALIQVDAGPEPTFIVLVRGGKRKVALLGRDLTVHRVRTGSLRERVCRNLEQAHLPGIDQMVERAGIPASRRTALRRVLLKEKLSQTQISGWWMLHLQAGTDPLLLARQTGVVKQLVAFLGAHVLQLALWISSWYLIGYGALQGRLDAGWLMGWALLLLTLVPLRLLVTWLQGSITVRAGWLLRRRLLNGAMNQELDGLRQQGIGQLLGRVFESEAIESFSLSGGLPAIVAVVELLFSIGILSQGQGGSFHAFLLTAWLGVALLLARRCFVQRRSWTAARLEMTHKLVENLMGYRTRLVQEDSATWNVVDDHMLERCFKLSRRMDRSSVHLLGFLPRGWLILGLLGLAPSFISGDYSPSLMAVALGGILLAHNAFESLTAGLLHLVSAAVAWKEVAPLFRAGAEANAFASKRGTNKRTNGGASSKENPLLETPNLSFRYRDRSQSVIDDCNLKIYTGDRILLQGSSGSGKSTLASLISGLRVPETGLILMRGLDHQTLGYERWRKSIVPVPQFHENYVFSNTLAFNLLLGRRWPPENEDLEEAEHLCRELGLESLITRMPGGLFQIVGETGWQLSHGERSCLYIARALLRNPDLLIMDESLSALNAETLERVFGCVLRRAQTLLVIAHA